MADYWSTLKLQTMEELPGNVFEQVCLQYPLVFKTKIE